MHVGFDYWNTLSHHTAVLIPLIEALLASGHEVTVMSAVGRKRIDTTQAEIEALGLPDEVSIEVLTWGERGPGSAPQLKYERCVELGITLFFDDRTDTCRVLSEGGIAAFQSPPTRFFEAAVEIPPDDV